MQESEAKVSCETHLQITKADGTVIDLGKVDAEHQHGLLSKLIEFVTKTGEDK